MSAVTMADVDEQIGHVRDLVFLRDLFAGSGATEEELHTCDAEIGTARERLAELARAASAPLAAAA